MAVNVELNCHPAEPCTAVQRIEVLAERHGSTLELTYRLQGHLDALQLPTPQPVARRDELWRHTCAELFVAQSNDPAYCELNFSPSGEWAAYALDDYRQGMRPLACPPPRISVSRSAEELLLSVQCELPHADASCLQLGLSMVIEDVAGRCSYWALTHPAAKPDFHRREAWLLQL